MRVLVTGGAGFIGSAIVRRLLNDGHYVRVFDMTPISQSRYLVDDLEKISGFVGDLRDPAAVVAAVNDIDIVFHEGALASVPGSVADPMTTMAVNVIGTLNVLIAARDAGVKRVIFASSSAVYGDLDVSPKHEALKPNPLSPYAISKLTGEQLCEFFFRTFGLETVSLRYFNVYGPGQRSDSEYAAVIPKFINMLKNQEAPAIHGDGDQSRDFIHIYDVVNANILAAAAKGAAGGVFNIASGTKNTINDIYRIISLALESDLKPLREPARAGDIRDSVADISHAHERLGFTPSVQFDYGIQTMVSTLQRSIQVDTKW